MIGDGVEADVFPYTVVRIGGLSYDDLASLDFEPDLLTAMTVSSRELNAVRSMLAEEIHQAVHGCEDARLRRELLAAKRALFNGRSCDALRDGLSGAGLPSLERYRGAEEAYLEARSEFEVRFSDQVAERKKRLLRIAAGDGFQKALMLSSPTLFAELPKYLSDGRAGENAKDLRVQRGLTKFVTRAASKTSPFSTFGHLLLGEVTPVHGAALRIDGGAEYRSRVRIASFVWARTRRLLLERDDFADHVRVRPNPTLQATSAEIRFLVNRHNVESFQLMPFHEGLMEIAAIAGEGGVLGTLVDRVQRSGAVEGSAADIRVFLRRLIRDGFLEFDLGISAFNPDWAERTEAFLAGLTGDAPRLVRETLRRIRGLLQDFGNSTTSERARILEACQESTSRLYETLQSPPQPDTPPQPKKRPEWQYLIYEDSARPDVAVHFDKQSASAMVNSLATLSSYLSFSGGTTLEQAQLSAYCSAKYGKGAVPLLRVYEDFYRDCKIPEQRLQQEGDTTAVVDYPGAEAYRARRAEWLGQLNRWTSALSARIRDAGRASVDRADITIGDLAHVAALSPDFEPRAIPGSAYVQPLRPSSTAPGLTAVVNGSAPGYGKTMSRFLDLFPEKVTELLRRANVIAAGPTRLAEVLDASVNNANMHPPLLPYEIWSPGAETSFPPERQIRVSDLNVAIGPEGEVPLALVESSTGERVAVMDVGFLAMGSRSQLLQLLVKVFSHTKYVNHGLLASAADGAISDESKINEDVVCQPRVVFDGHLVLRRRGWLIGREAIPERAAGESAASYFVRVNEWRCSLGMPPQVFATLSKTRPMDRKKNGPVAADAHKPQFISFDNWFTVDIFERMREKVQEPLLVEEMMPDPETMWTADGRRFATELIVQWSCNRP